MTDRSDGGPKQQPRQNIPPDVALALARVKLKISLKYGDLDLFVDARRQLVSLRQIDPAQLELPFCERDW